MKFLAYYYCICALSIFIKLLELKTVFFFTFWSVSMIPLIFNTCSTSQTNQPKIINMLKKR